MPQKPIESRHNALENFEEELTNKHRDLIAFGRLWLMAAKTGLVRPNWSIIPTVYAANKPKDDVPQKPPKMKYKDLPLYSTPHFDYKNYLEEKERCPGLKRRLIHECIYPCVRDTRKSWCKTYCDLSKDLREIKGELQCAVRTKKNQFISYMRCPDNLTLRQAIVALGGVTGFYLGSGRFRFTRRFVYAGVGLLATGALCFPKETDDTFREFTYHTSKFIIKLYNIYCNKNFGLRERVPCSDEIPEPVVIKNKPNECPPKK